MIRRLLYLNKSAEIGGSEMSLLLLVKHLDRQAYVPVVVLPAPGPFVERLQGIGVEVLLMPLRTIHWRGGNPFPYLATVHGLVRIIRRERIDLVVSNNDVSNQYGLPAARLGGVPIVCHLRELCSPASILHAFLPWSDHLIANSQAVARSYQAARRTPSRITVVHNAVDLSEFDLPASGRTFRERLGVPHGAYLVGIIGRIVAQKGHDVLLEAVAQVRQQGVDCRLAVVGPSKAVDGNPYQVDSRIVADMRRRIEALGLKEYVTLVGEETDLPRVYRSLDLLALPSYQEGFGRAALEAMAAGIPVVASATGGTPEVVDAGVTGLLIPPGDGRAWADAILALARDRERARRIGSEGRKRAERLFGIREHVRKIEDVYRQVLKTVAAT